MRTLTKIILTSLKLDDWNLLTLALTKNLATNRTIRKNRISYFNISAFADKQNIIKTYCCALFRLDFLETQDVTFYRAVLFATGAKNRIHVFTPMRKLRKLQSTEN